MPPSLFISQCAVRFSGIHSDSREEAKRTGNMDLLCKGNNGHTRRIWLPRCFKCTSSERLKHARWASRLQGGKTYPWKTLSMIYICWNVLLFRNLAFSSCSCNAKGDCTQYAADWNHCMQTKQEDLAIQHRRKHLLICHLFLRSLSPQRSQAVSLGLRGAPTGPVERRCGLCGSMNMQTLWATLFTWHICCSSGFLVQFGTARWCKLLGQLQLTDWFTRLFFLNSQSEANYKKKVSLWFTSFLVVSVLAVFFYYVTSVCFTQLLFSVWSYSPTHPAVKTRLLWFSSKVEL